MDPRFERFLKPSETKKSEGTKKKKNKKENIETSEGCINDSASSSSPAATPLSKPVKKKQELNLDILELDLFASTQENSESISLENEKDYSDNSDESSSEEHPKNLIGMFREAKNKSWLEQDQPEAKAAFNIINKTLHPERPTARGIAIVPVKGTSFPETREVCNTFASTALAGEIEGEILLEHDKNNAYDEYALSVIDASTGKRLGFIPKANDVNKTYIQAIEQGKFCGGYLIETKSSHRDGERGSLLMIATGWI
jgi:hypothetical protein